MRKMRHFSIAIIMLFISFSAIQAQATSPESPFILPQYSKRISLDFKDANLKDVLKVFSRQIGANFVLDSSIKETTVTVYLDNTPVEEALQRILTANELTYQYIQESNIFIVSPKDTTKKTTTRIYPLKYATVPSSKLNSTITIDGATGGAPVASGSSAGSSSGLIASIQASMSKDGKIAEDPRTNSLIITDEEEYFSQIEKVLSKLDMPVPQVLIEVKMLDVSKTAADALGVNYGDGKFFTVKGGSVDTFFPFSQKTILDKGGEREFRAGSVGSSEFTAVVNFLESRSDTQSLARPRILTLDNQTAQIKISTKETIGVEIQQTDSTSSGGGLSTETAERADTGIILTVTPQINLLTNEITMAVSPKVIVATSSTIVNKSTNSPYKDPEERSANIILKVKAGETIMLGGLLRKSKTATESKVPVLGSIPFLGRLFRYNTADGNERELVIFITPYILNDAGNPLDGKKKVIDFKVRENSLTHRSILIDDNLSDLSNQRRRK